MKVVLAGASGLVGGHFAETARQAGHELLLVGRRPLGLGAQELITDFTAPITLPTADAALCALGTTIAAAGSRRAFYAVDHDAVVTFAKAAVDAGIGHFLVVTAVGANPRASVYYSRVKGETERDLEALGFRRIDIAQPGLLLGAREERRPVESLLQTLSPAARLLLRGPLDRYAGIDAAAVARALLALCAQDSTPGVFRHENRALRALAA